MKKLMTVALVAAAMVGAAHATTSTWVAYEVNYRNNDSESSHYSHYLLTAQQASQLVYGSDSQSVDLNALSTKVSSLFSSSGYAATKDVLGKNCLGVNWFSLYSLNGIIYGGGMIDTGDRLVPGLYADGGFAVCLYENANDLAFVVADRNHISYSNYLNEDVDSVGFDSVGFFLTGSEEVEAGYNAAPWQTVSVPEPTSGLLLLLGMAGLALRRKRA